MTRDQSDGLNAERVRQYAENNPHATPMDVLAQLGLPPNRLESVTEIIEGSPQPTLQRLTSEDIRNHYRRARPVYDALATVCGHETLAIADHSGWYTKRPNDDPETADEWPKVGRCLTFSRDFERFLDRIERTAYATTSFNDSGYFDQWRACRYNDDSTTDWRGERDSATPTIRDTRAISAWGDIDLADELKPKRGDLNAATRETVEQTLTAYIDEFAALYGERDAVYALDSVGGAYIIGAPEATFPIRQIFGDDSAAADRVLQAFIERSNAWLEVAEQRVNERIDGAGDVIQPDWCNNPNRQYKAPLSVHKDHDAVVTPIDTEAVEYELTPFNAVDATLIEETAEWASAFTADEHVGCIDALVSNLWPDYYERSISWAEALREWVADERKAEHAAEEKRRQDERQRRERLDRLRGAVDATTQTITPSKADIKTIVESIDIAEVVANYASANWDTQSRDGKTMFDPSWRPSDSGTSCYVRHENNTFFDSAKEAGGGPAKAMALGKGIISSPTQSLSGDRWRETLDTLRSVGYHIPIWVPERGSKRSDGTAYEKTPLWALRNAAVALGVLPEHAFVTRESDDGGTYQGFPGRVTYDRTLDELEALSVDHGRERDAKSANSLPTRVDAGLEKEPEDNAEALVQAFKELNR